MAVTDYQSLYGACNDIALNQQSGTKSIGGYDTYIELFTQSDIDQNHSDIVNGNYDSNNNKITKCNFGTSDQSRIVLIAGDSITIPSGYTLIPPYSKKSLVILCGNFTNNGTISMTGRGPNILPHEYYVIGETDGFDGNVIIPAYANNGVSWSYSGASNGNNGTNGANGVNRNCGSGGAPSNNGAYNGYNPGSSAVESGKTGSGYAFGGGAGCGGTNNSNQTFYVDTTYPMRGCAGKGASSYTRGGPGGVGNPPGANVNGSYHSEQYTAAQNTGVGGRIIIFCTKFTNNGTISANGISASTSFKAGDARGHVNSGGASGGGAVDVFYSKLVTQGTIIANGGSGVNAKNCGYNTQRKSGNGGNGSITLTKYNMADFILPGYANKETLTKLVELIKAALATKANINDVAASVIDDTQVLLNRTYSSSKIIEEITARVLALIDDTQPLLTKTYSSQQIEAAILALIDDTQFTTNKTLSSQKIKSIIPTKVSQLENDKNYIGREITVVEVDNIWNNIFGV